MLNQAQYLALKNFSRLPKIIQRISAGSPILFQGYELNPTIQFILNRINGKQFEGMLVEEVRDLYYDVMKALLPTRIQMKMTNVYNITNKSHEISMYRYIPKQAKEPMAAIYYLHGGGLVIGSVPAYDNWLRFLADATGCCVYSLEYRKGPEYPFPTALEDTIVGWQWIHSVAQEHQIDTSRIAVMGDSGGGTLSTLLCQQARLKNLPQPALQCLLYPAVDYINDYPSVESLKHLGIYDDDMLWMRANYLLDDSLSKDPLVSPLFATDAAFQNLAPAIITTAGFDPLHEQGEIYALKLQKYRNQVIHIAHVNFIHGYIMFLETIPAVKEAVGDIILELRKALNT